ncbi:MAG: putative metal-binding motif-containing protein [Myxococcota bacterium]
MSNAPALALALAALAVGGCTGQTATECSEADKVTVYADSDKDGYGAPGTEKLVCPPTDGEGNPTGAVPRGYSSNDDDCDDFRSEVNPGANEACDGLDNDCDGDADEGLREIVFYLDGDGDGFGDADLTLSIASCGAPVGYVDNPDDCDDGNAAINPDAQEVCDNDVDNDCDGRADDADPEVDLSTGTTFYLDADGDSYGGDSDTQVHCGSPGAAYVLNDDDCNDDDNRVNPSITEVCNRVDDDCDNLIDDSDPDIDPETQSLWYADSDDDGYGDPDNTTLACFQPWFYVDNPDDCDDEQPLLGLPAPWLRDQDGDGFGAGAPSAASCTPPGGDYVLAALGVDCNDSQILINPLGNEICNGVDDDCDALTDDADPSLDELLANHYYRDADNDTFGNPDNEVVGCSPPVGYVADDQDCNDAAAAVNPDAPEVCDGGDNNCNDLIDDQDPLVDLGSAGTWWADFDNDGFGDPSISTVACTAPQFYVDNGLDCDDTDDQQLLLGPWVFDNDDDGVGAGVPSADSCTAPSAGWVPTYYGDDCDNNDPTRFPGNVEICSNGNDEDCDGVDPSCFWLRTRPAADVARELRTW